MQNVEKVQDMERQLKQDERQKQQDERDAKLELKKREQDFHTQLKEQKAGQKEEASRTLCQA